uniref:Uncharacterized protein LOC103442368 n=1 Tax=Rhizophora mucronata TaxID=61149 RepID=A0A2P2QZS2_RHIMU
MKTSPVKKLPDLRMIGANDPTLDLQSESVSTLQPQEIRCRHCDLP